jgi:hypothetical protein
MRHYTRKCRIYEADEAFGRLQAFYGILFYVRYAEVGEVHMFVLYGELIESWRKNRKLSYDV